MFDHAIEKEVKILNVAVRPLIQRTMNLWGAQRSDPVLVTDQYRDRDGQLASADKRLKLRSLSYSDHVELTIKQNLGAKNIKKSSETTKLFQQPELVRKRLALAGYECIRTKQKIRRQATIGDIALMIDEYAGIPPLLEIEGPSHQAIDQWIDLLSLRDHTRLARGYKGLMNYYNKQ